MNDFDNDLTTLVYNDISIVLRDINIDINPKNYTTIEPIISKNGISEYGFLH